MQQAIREDTFNDYFNEMTLLEQTETYIDENQDFFEGH